MGIFERLLGQCLLECLKAFLVCQYVVFPIFSGGVGLISSEVIALAAYLGSWALIAPVIASRFLLDSHTFFLEVIGVSN